jgi:hypothetical protein
MEVIENRDDFFYYEIWSEGIRDPLIEHVQFAEMLASHCHRFFSSYTPHQYISLDEGVGISLSLFIVRTNPVKIWYKTAYWLSDSTNGNVAKFKPNTEKSATGPSMNGATYDLVMNLMRGFFEKVGWFYGVQQYLSYIVAVSFIGGGNWRTLRKPPTCRKSLTNFIT